MAKLYRLTFGLNRGSRFPEGPASVTVPEAVALFARLAKACGVPAATIVPGFGLWDGQLENVIVATVSSDDATDGIGEAVADLAGSLRAELRQDAVFLEVSREASAVIAWSDDWRTREATVARLETEAS